MGEILKVLNTAEGLELLQGKLPEPDQIERVVMESTGGYERECAVSWGRTIEF
jgi:transposase